MFEQRRWPRTAWLPIIAGLLWLTIATGGGLAAILGGALPGLLLLGGGVSALLWPGDRRIAQYTAMGAFLGVAFGLIAWPWLGLASGAAVVAASLGAFLAAGAASVQQAPHVEDVPVPEPSLRLSARVAVDELVLASLQAWMRFPTGDDAARIQREASAAHELFSDAGWLEKPHEYHATPPELVSPRIERRRVRGIAFEHLAFESGYEPHPHEPGRDRFLSYAPNRTAHAWMLRHADAERPWLVCLHGFRMGSPGIDLSVFDPRVLHERLGLNLLVPVLPLHGPRKIGWRSGDGFLDGDVLDSVHAEAQAIWDLRRMLSWVRASGAPAVGVYGLSLGGYNAALLSALDPDLACVIAGIPLADMARIFWHHGPPLHLQQMESLGIDHATVSALFSPVSPLALQSRVPFAHRAIFAGVCDRIVPVETIRDLWQHWEQPRIAWYPGGHLSFARDPGVTALIRETLHDAGLTDV